MSVDVAAMKNATHNRHNKYEESFTIANPSGANEKGSIFAVF